MARPPRSLIPGRALASASALAAALAGCTGAESPTELNPDGPPMIRQVLLNELQMNGGTQRVLAFGTHPDAAANGTLEHAVAAAIARPAQGIRVIMDELLVGNYLEEILCRGVVDTDPGNGALYAPVPIGATPDDIARCSVAEDVLPQTCPASNPHSICIGPEGPVGVAEPDPNRPGAIDTRFIQGAVTVRCGDLVAAMDLDTSYWQPSGNQLVPATPDGLDALGPAIVLRPRAPRTPPDPEAADGLYGLPNDVDCNIAFAPSVVDKEELRACAPANGDVAAGCSPGDTSAAVFHTEKMALKLPTLPDPYPRTEMTGMFGEFSLTGNAFLDEDRLLQDVVVEVVAADNTTTRVTGLTIKPAFTSSDQTYSFRLAGGWAADTNYRVTVPPTITNVFGQALGGTAGTFTFHTAP